MLAEPVSSPEITFNANLEKLLRGLCSLRIVLRLGRAVALEHCFMSMMNPQSCLLRHQLVPYWASYQQATSRIRVTYPNPEAKWLLSSPNENCQQLRSNLLQPGVPELVFCWEVANSKQRLRGIRPWLGLPQDG